MALHPSSWPHVCALLYLAEFVEQFRNASQPLCGPLVVPVLEHQLHHLRVPSTDCLLQDCPALAALFAHVGIVSKEDSHRLQVPQGHSQLQGSAPPGVLLFNVVLGEKPHSAQGK